MFRKLTSFPSSGRAGGLVGPNLLVVSFSVAKPAAHTEDGEGVSARNVGKPYILTRLFAPENHAIPKFLFSSSLLYSEWTR